MTNTQKDRLKRLESKLSYGRGIYSSDWDELISLRRMKLEEDGLNPNDFDLRNRFVKRKNLLSNG